MANKPVKVKGYTAGTWKSRKRKDGGLTHYWSKAYTKGQPRIK